MNECGNCRHTNHLGLPDWSTMPCAACERYGADNDPTMWEAKPQTKYDRLVSMTPKVMALWFAKTFGDAEDYRMWMRWISSPISEEGEE